MGIAKDGHLIVGPFDDNGNAWQPCDVDVCNGKIIDGHYVYVLTMFYPYSIGCWGPVTGASYPISCTTNERVCITRRLRNLKSLN